MTGCAHPGIVRIIDEIKSQFPEIKILALTIHESDRYVLEAFEAGADGYCLKDAGRNELMVAVSSVLEGKTYISPTISDNVMEGYLTGRKKLKSKTSWDTITQREREVLKLLGEGYENKEISKKHLTLFTLLSFAFKFGCVDIIITPIINIEIKNLVILNILLLHHIFLNNI